eukprot:jgi/Picsp_1/5633/NSC_02992-R1_ribosomal rna large subunit methyltransferase f
MEETSATGPEPVDSLEDDNNSDHDSKNNQNLESVLEENLKSVGEAIQHMPLDAEMQEMRQKLLLALWQLQDDDRGQELSKYGKAVSVEEKETAGSRKRKAEYSLHTLKDSLRRSEERNHGRSMHPKNIYSVQQPDFGKLAELYPSLKQYLVKQCKAGSKEKQDIKIKYTIEFTNPDACRELVKAQLHHDFKITWDLPSSYLIPPLANRLNYLCWLHDLFQLWVPERDDFYWGRENDCIKILDIGCGANLIYPLLGSSYFGWCFVGADVNSDALQQAVKNREANLDIAPLIVLRRVEYQTCQEGKQATSDQHERIFSGCGSGILSCAINNTDGVFHASMCNPPFFSSEEEAGRNPMTDYGGTSVEMVYPGGEESFVRNMIRDSRSISDRIVWFTTMVGKKSTLKIARKMIHDFGHTVVRTTEFIQGKTSRWAIAWSFLAPNQVSQKPLVRTWK